MRMRESHPILPRAVTSKFRGPLTESLLRGERCGADCMGRHLRDPFCSCGSCFRDAPFSRCLDCYVLHSNLRFLLLFFLYSAIKGCGCLLRCIFLILREGMLGFVKMDEWMDEFTYD